jgi:hypothetical protein
LIFTLYRNDQFIVLLADQLIEGSDVACEVAHQFLRVLGQRGPFNVQGLGRICWKALKIVGPLRLA